MNQITIVGKVDNVTTKPSSGGQVVTLTLSCETRKFGKPYVIRFAAACFGETAKMMASVQAGSVIAVAGYLSDTGDMPSVVCNNASVLAATIDTAQKPDSAVPSPNWNPDIDELAL